MSELVQYLSGSRSNEQLGKHDIVDFTAPLIRWADVRLEDLSFP